MMTRNRTLLRVSDSLAACGEFALFVLLAPVAYLASVMRFGSGSPSHPPVRPNPPRSNPRA